MTETTETTEQETYRIRVEYDEWAESPAAWDWGFSTLSASPMVREFNPVEVGVFWDCQYQGLDGEYCDLEPLEHSELDESEWEQYREEANIPRHDYVPPTDITLIEYDTRGPYSTMREVDRFDPENWQRASEGERVRSAQIIGWRRDPRVFPEPFKPGEREEIVAATLREWNTWLQGNIYWCQLSRVTICHCCSQEIQAEVESLSGLYGVESVRDFLRYDMGLSEEEIEEAEKRGNADWIL